MKKEEENPRAFPIIADDFLQEGISTREYFASKAMQAYIRILSNVRFSSLDQQYLDSMHKEISKLAYKQADSMIEERTKNPF